MNGRFAIPAAFAILSLLLSAGCATKPENIAPAYVSEIGYMGYTDEQLRQEQARLSSALATASDAQRHARSTDAWGIALVGLPVSTLSGANLASYIGQLKGELVAVQKAMALKQSQGETAPTKASVEDRLKELEQLRKDGLITQEAYEKRRDEILKGI